MLECEKSNERVAVKWAWERALHGGLRGGTPASVVGSDRLAEIAVGINLSTNVLLLACIKMNVFVE